MTTADQYTAELRAEQRLTAIVRQRFPGFDYEITRGEIVADRPVCLHAHLNIDGEGLYGIVTVPLDARLEARIPDQQEVLERLGADVGDAYGAVRDEMQRLRLAEAHRDKLAHAYERLVNARALVLADAHRDHQRNVSRNLCYGQG